MYSMVSPLDLPRRADLTICGSHIIEYVAATNINERTGDKMTRTMSVRKMKSVTPGK
jgi:hypothetical protein